jgi:uncharacterized protein (DUF488 family)
MTLYTIGFTQKGAERFFSLLADRGVKRLLDIRLNNRSQLAGFAKRDDLRFFLQRLCGIEYHELPVLAPTQDILAAYKKNGGDWAAYERQFLNLLAHRRVAQTLDPSLFEDGCLLCSEHQPSHCHRRLVAEYLREQWGGLDIRHLQ